MLYPTAPERLALARVARGLDPPDLVIDGGMVLAGYELEFTPGRILAKDGRIAKIEAAEAPLSVGRQTFVVDAAGGAVVPGFIEPHGHANLIHTAVGVSGRLAETGVTTSMTDDALLATVLHSGDINDYRNIVERDAAIRFLWSARVDEATDLDSLRELLRDPRIVQVGEVPAWPHLLAEEPHLGAAVSEALDRGKKIDGHLPGGSLGTLAAAVSVGITADHEAITADEFRARLRVGLHTILRHSSLRPDLEALASGLLAMDPETRPWESISLTTDGSSPAFLASGGLDRAIAILLRAGLPEARAYSVAGRTAASYLGLGADLGVLAPRRLADLCILDGTQEPTPRHVFVAGRCVVENGVSHPIDMEPVGSLDYRPLPDHFSALTGERILAGFNALPDPVPVIALESTAITRVQTIPKPRLSDLETSGLQLIAHLDRESDACTTGLISGFAAGSTMMASTYTHSGGLLAVGADPQRLGDIASGLAAAGGGIFWNGPDGSVEIPLPLGGLMSGLPFADLSSSVERLESLARSSGYRHGDVLYTMLFLTTDGLPDVRVLPRGIVHVKSSQVLVPADG